MQYGWFIRGRRTKLFIRVSGSVLCTSQSAADATMFPTAEAARAFADSVVMAPELEIVDYTVHDPLPADADQTPVPTREQVIEAALVEDRVREAERNATWGLIQKAAVTAAIALMLFGVAFVSSGTAAASPRDNPFPPFFQQWSPPAHAANHNSRPRTLRAHARTDRRVVLSSGGSRVVAGGLFIRAHVNVSPVPPSAAVSIAERYIGGNPTGRASLWCADFVNMVERQLGRAGTYSREAVSFLRYGPHVNNPAPGDIVVLGRNGGGHVGYLINQTSRGPLIVSGNHGHRVGIGVYPASRVLAYVRPS